MGFAPDQPPIYVPITLALPSDPTRGVCVWGVLDTGSDLTILSPELAQLLEVGSTPLHGFLNGIHGERVPRVGTDQPVSLWHGQFDIEYKWDVKPLPCGEQLLLGRDIMSALGIQVGPIMSDFSRCAHSDHDDFIDYLERPIHVTDSPLRPDDEARRLTIRLRLQAALLRHTEQVPADAYISYPGATVRVMHEPDTPPAYQPQNVILWVVGSIPSPD